MQENPVVHFEISGDDIERMKKFYANAFGWEMNQMGPEMGNYVVVMTAKSDKNGPLEKGRINGGFYKKFPGFSGTSVVIAVNDLKAAMEKVKAAGGKILGGGHKAGEPDDIPGVGLYAAFEDSEGNRITMLQPKGM